MSEIIPIMPTGGRREAQAMAYMLTHPVITSWDAIQGWHDTRLPATIKRLKNKGIPIGSRMVYGKDADGFPSRHAEYWLEDKR